MGWVDCALPWKPPCDLNELRVQGNWPTVYGAVQLLPLWMGIIVAVFQIGRTTPFWGDFCQTLPSGAHRLELPLFSRMARNPLGSAAALSESSFMDSLGSSSVMRMSVNEDMKSPKAIVENDFKREEILQNLNRHSMSSSHYRDIIMNSMPSQITGVSIA